MKDFELAQRALGDVEDIWEYLSEDSFDVPTVLSKIYFVLSTNLPSLRVSVISART